MPNCRLCSSGEGQTVRAEYVFGGTPEHKFFHCAKCDAVYLYPVPTIEEEEAFYRNEFSKFMSKRVGDHRDWSNAEAHVATNQDQVGRRWKFLSPYLKKGMDVLEIGCSSGFMMNAFRDHGANPVGVEPSGEFLEFLHNHGHVAHESLADLKRNSPVKTFDLVTHFFVFEHIRDPFSFLSETHAMLNPGGTIVAEIPCVNDPLTSVYKIPAFERFYWSIAHHYYYSPKSLEYILGKLGMKYMLLPEQRYDLSNHIVWLMDGKPGGQGRFSHVFSEQLTQRYKEDLKARWLCDTIFCVITK